MSNIIDLPSVGKYHFGAMDDIKKYFDSHFEEINPTTTIINKAIILNIGYNPSEVYNRTDGYFGNCWTATLSDSRVINGNALIVYNFRNFGDLITHYEKEGFKFELNK